MDCAWIGRADASDLALSVQVGLFRFAPSPPIKNPLKGPVEASPTFVPQDTAATSIACPMSKHTRGKKFVSKTDLPATPREIMRSNLEHALHTTLSNLLKAL